MWLFRNSSRIRSWPLLQRSTFAAQTPCAALAVLRRPSVAAALHTGAASAAPRKGKANPRALNGLITGATRAQELVRLHEEHGENFDHINLATIWSRLGRLSASDRRDRSWLQRDAGAPLVSLRETTSRQLRALPPRELSNVAHALAKLDPRGSAWTSL